MINVSKLRPPSSRNALPRERLVKLADLGKCRPLIVISADAGYGKTTFMAQVQEALGGIGVWYQIDARDCDPAFFISHLTAGIKLQVPGFGEWVEERLGQVSDFKQGKEAVLTAFVNELREKVPEPVYFYFDDFHISASDDIVSSTVQFLVLHLPEDCRVFIAGRKKPDLPLARLRSQRAIVEIGKAELRFTLEETTDLLQAAEKPVSPKHIKVLYERTEGWPAALVLSQTLIESKGATAAIRQVTEDVATDYLTNELWDILDSPYKRFFMESSLLDPVDVELCDRISGIDEPTAKLLRLAEDRNLMVVSLGENLYRFHPLLREFLQKKLHEELGPERVSRLHCAYGDAFADSGDFENALEHFFAAPEFERAVQVLEKCGMEMLEQGRSQTVDAWLKKIPPAAFAAHPWLYYFKSQIDERRGNLNQALKYLDLANKGFGQAADRRGKLSSCLAKGEILANQTNHDSSLEALADAVRWAQTRDEKIDVHNRLGTQHVLCGNTKESLDHFARALEICDESMLEKKTSISIYMLNPLFFTGDFASIILNTENLLDASLKDKPILDRFTVLFYRILALFEVSEYKQSLQVLHDAESHFAGEKLGFDMAFDCMRGQNLLFGERPDTGRSIIEGLFSNEAEHKLLGPDCALIHLGALKRCRGKLETAMQIHEKALRLCYSDGKPYSIANALQHAAATRIRLDRSERNTGRKQLDEAFHMAVDGGYEYVKSQVYFHKAWLALQDHDTDSALSLMKSCLKIASRCRHDHFMVQEGASNLDLLALAFGQNIERRYLTEIFKKIGSGSLRGLHILLESDNEEIRKAAIEAFAEVGGPEAVTYVRKMTKDRDAEVRETAAAAVEKMRLEVGSPEEVLSSREMEVLKLIAEGLGNKDIADRLFISESTVKTHVTRIFNKLGLNKRSQAVAHYLRKPQTNE